MTFERGRERFPYTPVLGFRCYCNTLSKKLPLWQLHAEGVEYHLQDTNDGNHDDDANDAPQNVLRAFGALIALLCIPHIDSDAVDKVRNAGSDDQNNEWLNDQRDN